MINFIDRHPFISGVILGYLVFGRGIKRLIDRNLTIIKVIVVGESPPSEEVSKEPNNQED